jgi:hypothetical protein
VAADRVCAAESGTLSWSTFEDYETTVRVAITGPPHARIGSTTAPPRRPLPQSGRGSRTLGRPRGCGVGDPRAVSRCCGVLPGSGRAARPVL